MLIKRLVLHRLLNHLDRPEATVLVGSRQVGKTYLMRLMQNHLKEKGNQTVFLSLDVENDRRFFASQQSLIDYLRLQLGTAKGYVFMDEIQRKENAGLFLKGIYDMNLPYKFIVSGSGSLDIKAKMKESLAGRKKLFTIDPINFAEFVNFKTSYQYENKLQDFFTIEKVKTQSFLEEYMLFGGYPRVVLAETADQKRDEMDEIFRSYIDRDISDLLNVDKPEALTQMLKIIASQIGSLVNITELSNTIGISNKTVQLYLWYLEQTFILRKLTPFYRNIRSEITKAPVYYFSDTGLRNYLLGLFGLPAIPASLSGHLFENLVFNTLRQQFEYGATGIHFWRTRDQAEVDFVIIMGLEPVPVEVKFSELKKGDISRSFKSFLNRYKPVQAVVIHLGDLSQSEYQGTKISLLPYIHLPLQNFLRV